MSYEPENHLGTKGALGCIVILTALGLLAIWLFYQEVRMPELIYDGPPIGEFPPEESPTS